LINRIYLPLAAYLIVLFINTPAIALTKCELALFGRPVLAENAQLAGLRYDKIKWKKYPKNFTMAMREARKRVQSIVQNPAPPTFQNTILALEAADEPIELMASVMGNFSAFQSSPQIEALETKIRSKISRFENSKIFNKELFARVEAVYQQRAQLELTTAERTMLEMAHDTFVKKGANLQADQKKRIDEIDTRLNILSQTYGENLKADRAANFMTVSDIRDLEGLPSDAIAAAAAEAQKKKLANAWVFTLNGPTYRTFMTYATNRNLRERYWRLWGTRATRPPFDNRLIVLEMSKLRQEHAQILGYHTFADYILEDRMTKNIETVNKFIDKLSSVYKPAAAQELAEMQALTDFKLKPWDIDFYAERLSQERFHFSAEDLRPYFALDNVIEGAFFVANKLYGVTFVPRPDLPKWDPSVRVFELRDRDGKALALYYLDPFPRSSKSAGAWNSSLLQGGIRGDTVLRPHVVNVGNLNEPVDGKPALLSLDNVVTLFHELGHGMHAMLSKVQFRSISGTSVQNWDGVELPSKLNENWAVHPEVLAHYAKHYLTGEKMPADLIKKIGDTANFNAAWIGLRQVRLSRIDLAWSATNLKTLSQLNTVEDVEAWEAKAIANDELLEPEKISISASFSHLFAGGYSAGYYGYQWSEVIAQDAFSLFEKNGIFDAATANSFLENVLEKGGSEPMLDLYRKFRGGDPDPNSLFRSQGLIE
jgi:peptidyl-dipeptidase Dcp